jgi:Na+-translocating ferredoxin:NAD+ oxidoreductase RnfG subunit
LTVARAAHYAPAPTKLRFNFIWGGLALVAATPALSSADVVMTEKAALERAFPGAAVERSTLYLTAEQVKAVETEARSKLPTAVVTVFVARKDGVVTGRAVLDTHTVRTMPESLLTVVEPDGRLRMALVLQFGEPPDYLPREGWLKTFEGKALDDELEPGRAVRRVTGATLTVQALTDAVRRSLAIAQILQKAAK